MSGERQKIKITFDPIPEEPPDVPVLCPLCEEMRASWEMQYGPICARCSFDGHARLEDSNFVRCLSAVVYYLRKAAYGQPARNI